MATNTLAERIYNFSAGPAVLPLSVLQQAQANLLCLPGAGASILEISHRSPAFEEILASAESTLREILQIPSNYRVLFMQGGSRLQFSMVPMNLLKGTGKTADYIVTGSWGSKAYDEAIKEGEVNVAWNGKSDKFNRLPSDDEVNLSDDSAYVYFTSNETIQGVQYRHEPETGGAPLICDASSEFLCRPLPVEKYGLIYACAQKNAGPAGVTIVIIREDLLDRSSDDLPGYLNYKEHDANGSMYNTPPTFGIYLVDLITKWIRDDVGGLEKMAERNAEKSNWLYDVIDQSEGFYTGHAQQADRSWMNVTFRLPNPDLEQKFVAQAKDKGLDGLQGHRSVGGIRASIYNAQTTDGVQALRDFMVDFQKNN
ncbi:MAG: phosphoserine aminotransferase [Pirellulaceae bacterium]|jgi:phosphoserine aminotransferase